MVELKDDLVLSRPIELDRIPDSGQHERVELDADECDRLAAYLSLPAVKACRAELAVVPWRKQGFRIHGDVNADVRYVSVVSLDEFDARISDTMDRYFLRGNAPGPRADIVTVDPLEDDEPDPLTGNSIDLGVLIVEALALAVDPYPRIPGQTFEQGDGADGQPGEKPDGASPFAVLEQLKRPE